ncbi:MAG: DUF3786 domain-containing protein [Deltaproteobacteria bacterium]|jgi:hypothetical protein|nr:DUF3786 domain-containing protein [Deltaproteobacteria bacterium]
MEESSGYEKNYERLKLWLLEQDFTANAKELGLKVTEKGANARLLGRDYLISKDGVFPLDGEESHANCRSILIHYSLSQGKGEPGDEYLTLYQLPGVLRGRRDPGKDILNGKIERAFGQGGHELFAEAAKKIGGSFLGEHEAGGKLWHFEALPKIPLRVIFIEADEEYPVEVRVLFPSRAPEFLGFECLAFLNGCLADALVVEDS